MTYSKYLFFIFGVLVFSGCVNKSDRMQDPATQATFDVDKPVVSVATQVDPSTRADSLGTIKKIYVMKACVLDHAMQAPIQFLDFQIGVENIAFTRTTDKYGCFTWNETVEFEKKDQESIVIVDRLITGISGHKGTVALKLAINPWQTDVDVKDLRQYPSYNSEGVVAIYKSDAATAEAIGSVEKSQIQYKLEFDKAVEKTSAKSLLYLNQMNFEWQGGETNDYRISPLLNLSVSLKYRVTLAPILLRKGLSGEAINEPMATGSFKVFMAIVKDKNGPIKDSDILTATEKTYHMVDGISVEDLELYFSEISALNSRTHLIVTLTPSEEDPSFFGENSFSGILDGFPNIRASTLFPEKTHNAKTLYENFQRLQNSKQEREISPLQSFQANSGLNAVSSIKNEWIEQEVLTSEVLKELCLRYFSTDSTKIQSLTALKNHWTCMRDPRRFLNIETRNIIESLPRSEVEKFRFPEIITINIGATFDIAATQSQSQGHKTSAGASIGAGVGADLHTPTKSGVLDLSANVFAKISVGYDYFWTSGFSKTKSTSSRTTVTTDRTASVEVNAFSFDATYRKCLVVTPKNEDPSAPRGFFACGSTSQTGRLTEKYYLLNQALSTSLFTDARSASNSQWRMLIRGERVFEKLKEMLGQEDLVIEIGKMPEDPSILNLPETFTNQEFPGML